ncbi:NADH dehydrogenase subunit 4 (mitochondrion) [Alligator mississippiensis]|uniref:NADH-ubiquinone oxidoreductase chain 4 n=1 Tax=Alligator mississippiensis TaxID=8496 RepID=O47876_ALLMI|nr:NADH dehydrogenase subunit 4 [Alligator mississippiensis]AAD09989.1 NADH dehydrogenase subunit IV [Alligator mississippiensis]CAA73570.1 NADH dehydrogenase subunit 4 [Alligator mississippiensis]
MLKLLLATFMLIPTTPLLPNKITWLTPTTYSIIVTALALLVLNPSDIFMNTSGPALGSDQLSTPLMILSCWLLPLMLMASQNSMLKTPAPQNHTFITILAMLQFTLLMTFMALDLMLFYISFEATLIPTLIIISRWGAQADRLNAGIYFLFYTITSSIPLMIGILMIYNLKGTLSILTLQLTPMTGLISWTDTLLWLSILLAFLVKIPLYGLHLWLPKAHVEAPIAGSMVLAAVLLKLGGYGLLRVVILLTEQINTIYPPILGLALWGALMTSLICLRQTDLKSLIAYSSVSHMALVTAAILTRNQLTPMGSMILMIAHGLTSSMLFCLANFSYERTHTRTLLAMQGMQLTTPTLTSWWFLASMMNMALPPTINFVGELALITSLFNWSETTLLLTGLNSTITAIYTLYMFSSTQQGTLPIHTLILSPTQTREHLLMLLHTLPSIILITNPRLIYHD